MLSGANTFSGLTTINGGTIEDVVSSATGTISNGLGTSNVTLNNGTVLQFDTTANTTSHGLNGRAFVGSGGGVASSFNYGNTAVDSSTYFTTGNLDITGGASSGTTNYASGPVGTGLPNSQNFAVQWSGKIMITNSGYYSFYDNSDDGSRVLIDGALATQVDGGRGVASTLSGVGDSIFLTAGLHDLTVDETQGTSGWQTTVSYSGADTNGVVTKVPSSVLYLPETSSTSGASNAVNLGNNIAVNGSATISMGGNDFTAVQIGVLTPAVGSQLTVTGLAGRLLRATGTSLGSPGTVTFNTVADLALGQVTDNSNPVTIVKLGSGHLIFDNAPATGTVSSLLSSTVIDIQAGSVVVKGVNGGSDPIGNAQLKLDGGILTLDSQGGAVTYNNAVTLAANGTIQVVPEGQTVTLGGTNGGISLGTNNLTIDVFGGARISGIVGVTLSGATLSVPGVISGSGNITVRSDQYALSDNFLPVNGNLTLSAANTFSGSLTMQGEPVLVQTATGATSGAFLTGGGNSVLTLNGNGSILNSTGTLQFTNAQLTIDNSSTNLADRISNSQNISLNQSIIQFTVNGGAVPTTETVGTVTLSSGFDQFRMSAVVSAQNTQFTMASLVRSNRSTLAVFDVNAGTQATTGVDRFTVTDAATSLTPLEVGGGGAAGSKNISILPFVVANTGTTAVPVTWGLATYDTTQGSIRGLTASEYNSLATAGATDNARDSFGGGAQAITGTTVNAYVLDNSTTTAMTVTLSGTLALTSGALVLSNGAPTGTSNYAATTITGGTIAFGTAEGNVFVMTPGGATINSTLTGSGGLTVSGNGQLTLGADNSAGLTGQITINGTTLNVTADNRLGNASNNIVFGGGVLRFGAAFTLASTRGVTLLANSFGGFDTSGGSGVVAGIISGSGDLAKLGNSTSLTLSNAGNTFSGRVLIYGGSLIAGVEDLGASNVIINNGATLLTAGTAGMNFNELTTGSYTYNGSISGSGSVSINITNGGTFTYGGVNTYGGGTVIASSNTTLIGNDQNINGFVTSAAGVTGSAVQMNESSDATSYATLGGAVSFVKTGAGVLTLVNSSSSTGTTTITGANAGLGTSGGISLSAGNQLGAGGITVSGNAILQATAAQFASSANTVDLGTRGVAIGAGGANFDVGTFTDGYDVDTAPNVLSIGGVISGTTTDNLTKTGTGTLILGGANTYSDNTVVSAGTVQLALTNAIPGGATAGNVSLAGGATIDLHGFSDTINGLSGAGTVDDTAPASSATLTVGGNNQTASFSGVIQNSGAGATTSLAKIGSGTETLSGNSTFGGQTSIQNGALSVSTLNSFSGGTASSSLGTPSSAANDVINFGDAAGDTGTLIITGAGGETTDRTVNFAGANAGATIETDGSAPETFTANTTSTTGTGTNTFTLQGSNTGANTFQGTIGDTGTGATSLVKAGVGNWALGGANTYTGTTAVNAGNLQVGVGGTGRTGSGNVTVASSATLSGTGTVAGTASVSGVVAPGDKFGQNTGVLTFSQGLTMNTNSQMQLQANGGTLNDQGIISAFSSGGATGLNTYLNGQTTSGTYNVTPTANDKISVTGGTLTLTTNSTAPGGAIDVTGTYTGFSGDVIDLLAWTGTLNTGGFVTGGESTNGIRAGGTMGDLTLPTLTNGDVYDVSQFLTGGYIVVVPEPSRGLLLLFGAAMLLMRRRRRSE
jgi:autotransporter-associated beta strand protein